jgi:effector-binding domain-containing protein
MNIVKMPGGTWAFVRRDGLLGAKEISGSVSSAFDELTRLIAQAGVRTIGPPRAHYHYRDGQEVGFDIGFPIESDDETTARKAGLLTGETLSGEALMHIHRGPYAGLKQTYRRMEKDLCARGLRGSGDLWEFYLNDPDECPAPELLTQVLWPVEHAAHA